MKQIPMFVEEPSTIHRSNLTIRYYKPKGHVVDYDDEELPAPYSPMTIVHLGGSTRQVTFCMVQHGYAYLDLGSLNGGTTASLKTGLLTGMKRRWRLEQSALLACRRLACESK